MTAPGHISTTPSSATSLWPHREVISTAMTIARISIHNRLTVPGTDSVNDATIGVISERRLASPVVGSSPTQHGHKMAQLQTSLTLERRGGSPHAIPTGMD